jgi:hypothetical protein
MAQDKRELILDRLRDVVKVKGVSSSARNSVDISDQNALPSVIVYDGTEEALDSPPGRAGRTIQIIRMEPIIQVTLQGDEEKVGTDLNGFRLRLLDAVTGDAELKALALNGESPRYLGCLTKWTKARGVQGDMVIRFSILYALSPNDF